ncbi:MAG: hypothetical protein Q7N95_02040 [Alphaproteobacteria bacterium]|nr:hypothetical protein [Alphaproteobacteria bacterium]
MIGNSGGVPVRLRIGVCIPDRSFFSGIDVPGICGLRYDTVIL